jgi:hypothetical protein
MNYKNKLTLEEKKELIKNIVSLGDEERSKLIDDMLKSGNIDNA